MTARQTHARRARHQRAALLGCLLATSSAAGASALLFWSIRGLASTHGTAIPVAEGVVLVTGSAAGVVAAGLAYAAGLGALALRATASPEGNAQTLRIAPRLAARSATLLLALVVGAPVAHAGGSPVHPDTSTSALAPVTTVAATLTDGTEIPLATAPLPAHEGGESDVSGTISSSLGSTTPPRPVPLPGWQSTRARPATAQAARPEPAGIVVKRGDTLWSIAAADLAPDASDTHIAAHWPRWYEANRLVIGPNPDLILPGHILQPPTPRGEQP